MSPDDEVRLSVSELIVLMHQAFSEGTRYEAQPSEPHPATDLEGRKRWFKGKFLELESRLEVGRGGPRPKRMQS